MAPEPMQRGRYVSGIDGLRAVAVLSVMVYHLHAPWLPAGFVGVDIFFVISGFVISKSLADSPAPSFGRFILDFYRRRMLRLVPALAVFLVAAAFVSVLFVPQAWLSAPNDRTALFAFFGLSNFHLVNTADGYFNARIAFNPFVHTWSLAVEEQFYLFFPALFYVWMKHRHARTRAGTFARAVLPVVVVASLFVAAIETPTSPERAFYLLPSRFWELGVGALLFQWLRNAPQRQSHGVAGSALLWSGAALLAVSFRFVNEAAFPFPWAVVPVTGAALAISGIVAADGRRAGTGAPVLASLLAHPVATYIGRISYSLYLWHWGVFVLMRWTVGLSTPADQFIAVALAFALAALSYHYPESFFRSHARVRRASSPAVVAAGVCVLAAATAWTSLVFDYRYRLGLSVTARWNDDRDAERDRRLATNEAQGRKLFVVGDSHALEYRWMARTVAESVGASAVIVSSSGCSVAGLVEPVVDRPACRGLEQRVLDRLRTEGRRGDIVLLASLRVPRYGDQWGPQAETPATPARPVGEGIEQARRVVAALRDAGFLVMFDAPPPVFRAPPFRCADWFNRRNPVCAPGFEVDRDELLRRRQPAMDVLSELQRTDGVVVWDPFPDLCPGRICSAFDGQAAMFYDGDHLSAYGNRRLVPSFARTVRAMWQLPPHAAAAAVDDPTASAVR